MKLPIIKHLVEFIKKNDEDFLLETLETLEALTEAPSCLLYTSDAADE